MINLKIQGTDEYVIFNENNNNFIKEIKNYIKISIYEKILPVDEKSLFKQTINASKTIDTLFKNDYYDKDIILQLLSLNFCWHNNIRFRHSRLTTEYYTYSYIFSWLNLCRLYTIKLYINENYNELLKKKSNDINFIKLISQQEKFLISDNSFENYSIKLLWQSIVLLWPCLYKYPYSDDMRIYLNILHLLYSLILSHKNEDFKLNDYPRYYIKNYRFFNNDYNNDDDDCDDEKFNYNNLSLKIDDEKIIKSCLIFEGEVIFYHQLTRMTILKKLFSYYSNNKFFYKYKDISNTLERLNIMVDQFKESLLLMSNNEFIKINVWEILTTNLSKLYIMHGEEERYFRENPNLTSIHPDNILSNLRFNDFIKINGLKDKITKDFINEYIDEMKRFLKLIKIGDEYENIFKIYHSFTLKTEREVIFLTFTCLEKFFSLSKINIEISKIFLSEYFTELKYFEDIVYSFPKGKIPILLNIMKHNFIIDYNTKKIYHSLFFIETFILWIVILSNYQILNKNQFKELKTFIDFIVIYS